MSDRAARAARRAASQAPSAGSGGPTTGGDSATTGTGTGTAATTTGGVRKRPRKSTPTPSPPPDSAPAGDEDTLTDDDGDFKKAEGKRFRRVRQGHGQVYQVKTNPTHMGTLQLDTCLAVYFAIDSTHFFFAHVNFDIQDENGEDIVRVKNGTQRASYQLNPAAFRAARLEMKRMLNTARTNAIAKNWWGGVTDTTITNTMVNSLIMSSPFSNIPGKLYIADALAQGVREWMGIDVAQYGHYPIEKYKRMIFKHPIKNSATDLIWLEGNLGDDGAQFWQGVPEGAFPWTGTLPFGSVDIRRNGLGEDGEPYEPDDSI